MMKHAVVPEMRRPWMLQRTPCWHPVSKSVMKCAFVLEQQVWMLEILRLYRVSKSVMKCAAVPEQRF